MPGPEAELRPWLCLDRIVPEALLKSHAATGVRRHVDVSALKPSGEGTRRMAVAREKRWNKRTIDCRFLDGSDSMRARVKRIAQRWSDHCGITFRFTEQVPADIRISFYADSGSWSAVGTDALIETYFPRHQPTMNFGWLRDGDPRQEEEWNRVVLHEFGHALGCIHEHSSPEFDRVWNRAAVLKYFSGPPNFWTAADIEHNVIRKYETREVDATEYDSNSIMLYSFDAVLFSDKLGPTNTNSELSEKDIQMIGKLYPK